MPTNLHQFRVWVPNSSETLYLDNADDHIFVMDSGLGAGNWIVVLPSDPAEGQSITISSAGTGGVLRTTKNRTLYASGPGDFVVNKSMVTVAFAKAPKKISSNGTFQFFEDRTVITDQGVTTYSSLGAGRDNGYVEIIAGLDSKYIHMRRRIISCTNNTITTEPLHIWLVGTSASNVTFDVNFNEGIWWFTSIG